VKKPCTILTLLAVAGAVFFGCSDNGGIIPPPLGEVSNSSEESSSSIDENCDYVNFEIVCTPKSSDDSGNNGEESSSSNNSDYSSPSGPSSNSIGPISSSSAGSVTPSSSGGGAISSSSISPPQVPSSSSVPVPVNTCAYQPSLCGGIAFDDILTTSFNSNSNGQSLDEGPNCIFALGITKLGNENGQGGGLKVNGTKLTGQNNSDVGGRCGNTDWGQQSCADAIRNIQKIDGGYYIYAPAWAGDVTTTGGNPICAGGSRSSSSFRPSSSSAGSVIIQSSSSTPIVPLSSAVTQGTLTCANVPSTGIAGQSINAPAVNCNGNVVTGSNITWSGTPNAPNWSNPNSGPNGTPQNYTNIRATVTAGAGGTAQACRNLTAGCNGTLTVNPPPAPSSASQPSSASTGGGSCETCVASNQLNQNGTTTRYWDGCKPSCAWPGKQTNGQGTAKTCNISGGSLSDANAQSACGGGPAFTCMNQAPWSINDNVSFGFAASHTDGDCGKCFQLEFTGAGVSGKTLVVMVSNIGGDVRQGQFDLMIPGGGVGQFDAISRQLTSNGVSNPQLGQTYGGFRATCGNDASCVQRMCNNAFGTSALSDLKRGCDWYVTWMKIADNPTIKYKEIPCPSALKAKW